MTIAKSYIGESLRELFAKAIKEIGGKNKIERMICKKINNKAELYIVAIK